MKDPRILYEDENIVALNKPSGISVHGDGAREEETLSGWILKRYPDLISVGEPTENGKGNIIVRPGIVHRLDKGTSGVILVAKNQETFFYLKGQFQERKIDKTYRAIVYGDLKKKEGIITAPIGRSGSDFRKKVVRNDLSNGARDAETRYKVLRNFSGAYTYLEAYPKTGRTHQIRVHLSSIGHPVVCDGLYASKKECPEALGRLGLHAFSVSLTLPSGSRVCIEAEEPGEFRRFLAEYEKA